MAENRLPVPGSDAGQWGEILNAFLKTSHNNDGTLKPGVVGGSQIQDSSVSATKLDPSLQSALDTAVAGVAPDASTSSKGVIRLTGDLTGTALSPLIAQGAVTGGGGGSIATGTITNVNIHASAAIDKSKLAPLAIVNNDISVSAAIAQSKVSGLVGDLANKAPLTHTHQVSDVENLEAALDNKAEAAFVEAALEDKANSADVTAALNTKANTSDVTTALAGKANATHTHSVASITGLESTLTTITSDVADKANADDLTQGLAGKANTSHTHTPEQIADLDEHVADIIGNKLIPGNNVSINYDIQTGETTISSTASSQGGEGSSTVTTVAGRTGDVVLVAGDITGGTFASARIPNLDAAKIATGTLDISHIPTGTTGTTVSLGNHTHGNYAATSHTHDIEDVTDLQSALDAKAAAAHGHVVTDVTGLQAALDAKAGTSHVHAASDITSGVLGASQIPNLAATKITSGLLDVARIPTGTTNTTVALGNHTHSNYAATTHTHDDRYYTETEVDAFLTEKLNAVEKGNSNGVATLGSDGKIPASQLPAIAINETFTIASQAAMLSLTAQRGDMAIRTDTGRTFVLASDNPLVLSDWKELTAAGQVSSVNGNTGAVVLTAASVGAAAASHTHTVGQVEGLQSALDTKATVGLSRPEVTAANATTWPTRASVVPAGYTGPVTYHSGLYLDHPAPTDMQPGDDWIERVS